MKNDKIEKIKRRLKINILNSLPEVLACAPSENHQHVEINSSKWRISYSE